MEIGRGVKADIKEAEKLYEKAANLDDPEGLWRLYNFQQKNKKPNLNLKLLEKSSLRSPTGKLLYTQNLINSGITKQNLHKAHHILLNSVNSGTANLSWVYGSVLSNPRAGSSDPQTAFKLMKLASDQGCVEAEWRYGFMQEHGIGCNKNPENAQTLLLSSAEKGCLEAILRLGVFMETKESPDMNTATMAYKVASNMGDKRGHYFYGCALFAGLGITEDQETGLKLIQQAADAGLELAQLKYARVHHFGVQIDVNLDIAKKYYQLAANLGNQHAVHALSRLKK